MMLLFAQLIVKLNVVINSNFVRTRHQGLLGCAFTMVAGPDRRAVHVPSILRSLERTLEIG